MKTTPSSHPDSHDVEVGEWIESFDAVVETEGTGRAGEILDALRAHVELSGVSLPCSMNTPYVNTIPTGREVPYPGNRAIERRIKSLIRWNAMAMVVRANRNEPGIGGHISTYASAATLYEVGFHHFFRGRTEGQEGDLVYFQGHAAPGIYARAFLEGRLTEQQLVNYRRELAPGGGLSSYPHPYLMPSFWQFPTVSMGLGPLMAIYQARFNRYLENRGLKPPSDGKVWAFLGDGEMDEPESLGAITLASREKLDNLIFVVNCNLQRLDGPVRGNGKIIQELEAAFRGAGWNVIKVIWGSNWDPLLADDRDGRLVKRMNEVVDGQYQKYKASDGRYVREHFFGADPELAKRVEGMTDEQLWDLRRGGHDPVKVYNAFKAASEHRGGPSVVLAKTIKGYGLGESGEGKNISHQQKKLNEEELHRFARRFDIPIPEGKLQELPFIAFPAKSEEAEYLRSCRRRLGGSVPSRSTVAVSAPTPASDPFGEFRSGSQGTEVSTTMVFVRILSKLLKDPRIGRFVVPIVPDEARTFGMEALFRQCGIYASGGQLYEPVDSETLLYYREARDGQILEEGITEAGSISSFIAAGTAYATHGIPTIPFFIYYSMFGLQRVGDEVWAAADARCRGFLVGATAGRTTLAGEGLQHQDGQSHLLAYPVPTLRAYDPAFAYEVAEIVREGLARIAEGDERSLYYLTVGNEPYPQPEMPKGVEEGIIRGIYRFRSGGGKKNTPKAHLFGSGSILNEALKAQTLLANSFGVAADVWSVTSYKELRHDALEAERWNLLHPSAKPRVPYLSRLLTGEAGPFVAASDYVRALPDSIAKWLPGRLISLGTDGFGRSEGRRALRDHFEVDARYIALAALYALARDGVLPAKTVEGALRKLDLNPEKMNPMLC